MKIYINIIATILLSATMACGNRQSDSLPVSRTLDKESLAEDTTDIIKSDDTGSDLTKQEKAEKIAPTSSQNKDGHVPLQDNMRGFDPASEDDMDDNGMSRYMENNDEEGWD